MKYDTRNHSVTEPKIVFWALLLDEGVAGAWPW